MAPTGRQAGDPAMGRSELMEAVRETSGTARTSPAFVVALGLTLAAAGFNALMVGLMALRLDALLPGPFAQMGHFTEPHHRVHDLTFGLLFLPSVLGLVAQFRRPAANVAGMLMTLVPPAALLAVLVLTVVQGGNTAVLQPPWMIVMAGALLATALHPAGSDFFRSFRLSRLNPALLALVAVAAVALLPFTSTNIGLQASVPDDHAAAGHYGFMAAFALATLGLGVLASLRPDGWRLTAWNAGLLPMLIGATSLIYPGAMSSLAPPWALAAITWAAVFVAAAELSQGRQPTPSAPTSRTPS
jgi:hypothetical protein